MENLIIRKEFLTKLGFLPKNNSKGIYQKKYVSSNYHLEVDFEKKIIDYGKKIKSESKTSQNFSQEENWVVLECVDRLLNKGYKPEDLILEKVYPTGHSTSGRLDILVLKNKKAYLMIECKTFGNEFKKEFQKVKKKGGQLFTYFQQDRATQYLILYASKYEQNKIRYTNEIIKIEDSYRETSNVKELYERWSKLTSQNGLFDGWVNAYDFKSKALTLNQLKVLTHADSSFIFNRFLEILRHNVVSDKPNAFNKIFTLFLCKIIDENKNPDDQLDFQWIEGIDDNISFQKRLADLYKRGMQELLSKEITDISDDEFHKKYGRLDDDIRKDILKEITKIRLQKNNEFAIKEVFDEESFEENARVLKEVVELLQIYKIRYAEKQQYLSDFFELLLTTRLKQESGQFFTPVPIARFICRSIPLQKITEKKLLIGAQTDLLPAIIDYATGSGHFLTESMDEIQNIIQDTDVTKLKPQVKKDISAWKTNPFVWAYNYIYGIEKDYRLVKTTKVGCYLHGDGVAQVIHTDGLNNFNHTKEYKNKLNGSDKDFPQDSKNFDIVISNPPYSVSAFKTYLKREFAEKDFELYKYLTDQSSEIECLFVERTKQLLKDGGIAGIILPSSILSNTGIYTKTREIILKYFDIIGITELGSNTFMATGTNTVILFLRRKNNYEWENIKNLVDKISTDLKDITINNIENIFSKYVRYVWKDISFNDYLSLFKGKPKDSIIKHKIYKEYEKLNIDKIIELEKDKLLYFILAYPQKIVLVKTGEKEVEKSFLGYKFSNRRGSEGIHPIQSDKLIDECTKLFDPSKVDNPKKASTYILDAFENRFDRIVDEELKDHISRINLIDMVIWGRNNFEKQINVKVREKVDYEEVWNHRNLVNLKTITNIEKGTSITKEKVKKGEIPVIAGGKCPAYYHNQSNRDGNIITISASGAYSGFVNYFEKPIFASDSNTVKSKDETQISTKLIFYFLKKIQNQIYKLQRGQAQAHVYSDDLGKVQIPLPTKRTQKKIIEEIKKLEDKENIAESKIKKLKQDISIIINSIDRTQNSLEISDFADVKGGKRIPKGYSFSMTKTEYPYIRVADFSNGTINQNSLNYINEKNFNIIKQHTISINDIYISIAGTIGLVGIIPLELNNTTLTENAAKITNINSKIIGQKYLYYLLLSKDVQLQIKNKTKTLGVPKLALKRIGTIKIPILNTINQSKMVKKIETIEHQIYELETKLKEIPKMKEVILTKYL
jgi:type I restriction enzyme M protein